MQVSFEFIVPISVIVKLFAVVCFAKSCIQGSVNFFCFAVRMRYVDDSLIRMKILFSGRLDRSVLDIITAEIHTMLKQSEVDVKSVTRADIEDLKGTK